MNSPEHSSSVQPLSVILAGLGLAIVVDYLLMQTPGAGIGLVLSVLCFFFALAIFTQYTQRSISKQTIISGLFLFAFSVIFAVWDSVLGRVMAGLGFSFALMLFLYFLFGYSANFLHPIEFFRVFYLDIRHMFERLNVVAHIRLHGFLSKRSRSVLLGLIFAIPLLVVFIAIFLSADLLLSHELLNWVRNLDSLDALFVFGRVFWIPVLTVIFTGIFAGTYWRPVKVQGELPHPKVMFKVESAVVLACLTALFAMFILFQMHYLFGGEQAFRDLDISVTYSSYARHGFYELAVAAAFVMLIGLTMRVFHHERTRHVLVWLHAIFIVETLFILFSAGMRLWLYIDAYGFTPARLFGLWFLGTLGLLFLLLLWNVVTQSYQEKFMRAGLFVTALSLLAFCVISPDLLAIKLQLARNEYKHLALLDFRDLHAEAIPVIREQLHAGIIIDDLEPMLTEEELCSMPPRDAMKAISKQIEETQTLRTWSRKAVRIATREPGWQSWNLSRNRLPLQDIQPVLRDGKSVIPFYPDGIVPERYLAEIPSCVIDKVN